MEDKVIVMPSEKARKARQTEDIKDTLAIIPKQLHPAVNAIALELAEILGYKYEYDFDFLNSTDTRAVQMCRLAVASMWELQEFCIATYGTNLTELVDTEKE